MKRPLRFWKRIIWNCPVSKWISRAAAAKGFCSGATRDGLIETLRQYGLPTETEYPLAALAAAMGTDKKLSGGTMHLVVPREIGRCEIVAVPRGEVSDWLRAGGVR